jgi:hypothetical protein
MLPLTPWIQFRPQAGHPGIEPGRREIWSLTDVPSTSALFRVGSEGVEPSPYGLKDRYAAVTPRPRLPKVGLRLSRIQ